MKDTKTSFDFAEGDISEREEYEWDMHAATIVESVIFFLSGLITNYKLSGKISIEIKDRKLYIDYDVKPKQYEIQLKHILRKKVLVCNSEE